MSFCGSCGTNAGQGRFCPSCGAPTASAQPRPSASEMNSGQQPLYGSTPQPAFGSSMQQTPLQRHTPVASKSLGAAITLLVFACLGFIGTYLPFLTFPYNDGSLKGWDSVEVLRDGTEEFSAGPYWIVFGSIAAAICALVILVNMNKSTNSNRVALGTCSLIAGIAVLGAAGATYSALDNVLKYEGDSGSMGIGLWLGIISGLAITILGIVILTSPKSTQVN